jgi:hypothetical protein
VITLTGDRLKVFELCKLFMSRQTCKPFQWIIVDDGIEKGDEASEFSFAQYIRRVRNPAEPKHTLLFQMIEALKRVEYDKVIMMEDDDYYFPTYFETMLSLFDKIEPPSLIELVGQGQAFYYNFRYQRHHVHDNKAHASLCQTAFRKSLIPTIQRLCRYNTDPFLDMRIWRQPVKKYLLLGAPPLVIGMKGLPGRTGIGNGHIMNKAFTADVHYQHIRKFIGDDVELYRKILSEN